ncbi:MAG: DUF1648 domain-containing protein [Acutalibacter sp.]
MKAFLKTYWLEFLFFAVGLVGAVIAMPFLPASVPLQFQGDGVITRTGPKWAVFIIPAVQLQSGFHWWIGRCLEKLPALAHTLAGMERLLPAVLSIILLTLELCVLLAAWGVTIPLGAVLLVELLLVPIVFIGFVAAKILGNIGKLK